MSVEAAPRRAGRLKSTDGTTHAGVVTFHWLSDTQTKVTVQLEWHATELAEKAAVVVGIDDHQVNADLKRFKNYIEQQGREGRLARRHHQPQRVTAPRLRVMSDICPGAGDA